MSTVDGFLIVKGSEKSSDPTHPFRLICEDELGTMKVNSKIDLPVGTRMYYVFNCRTEEYKFTILGGIF